MRQFMRLGNTLSVAEAPYLSFEGVKLPRHEGQWADGDCISGRIRMIFIQIFHSFRDSCDFPTHAPFLLFPVKLGIASWPKSQSLHYRAGTRFGITQIASGEFLPKNPTLMVPTLLHLQNTQE
jgi:hypothetical protein